MPTFSLDLPDTYRRSRRNRLLGAIVVVGVLELLTRPALGDQGRLRGDPAAIRDAEAMVETMGGKAIWSQLKSVHFVHRWDPGHRVDTYLEDEILDLTKPRSWVKMESEITSRVRAYSPEHGYWTLAEGRFSRGSEEQLAHALERAPYHFCRLARRIAIADPQLEVRFGPGDIPQTQRLEFYGPDGVMHGWIILNARKEPIVWATTQYRYTFGPMARFGNLRVPNWAVYDNGSVRYEMVSLSGSNRAPELSLFAPPEPEQEQAAVPAAEDRGGPVPAAGQARATGIRGDPAAIADAEAMVETMGGATIWSQLKRVHFVHEWHPWNREDAYVEDEILDLSGPRSWVDRKSEINRSMRAYSPEGGRWTVNNGEFTSATDAALANDLARAPFNFYRLVRAVAAGDSDYEIRFGEGDIPGTRRLEFYGRNGTLGGWVILNARKEPIVKATPEYRYALGPLKRFGNLSVPAWGVYDNGTTRYEMISLTGDSQPPDLSLFLPPTGFRDRSGRHSP